MSKRLRIQLGPRKRLKRDVKNVHARELVRFKREQLQLEREKRDRQNLVSKVTYLVLGLGLPFPIIKALFCTAPTTSLLLPLFDVVSSYCLRADHHQRLHQRDERYYKRGRPYPVWSKRAKGTWLCELVQSQCGETLIFVEQTITSAEVGFRMTVAHPDRKRVYFKIENDKGTVNVKPDLDIQELSLWELGRQIVEFLQ